MASKMPRRLVALSSSAIATIYFAGLLSTRAAADGLSTPATDPATATATPAASATATPTTLVVGATATPTSTTTSGYRDGTYTGSGSGRFGSVSVSVTVAGGSITNVSISNVSTTFPVSQIASLPQQVIQKQSANVNVISGATASSQAFKQAVQQALAQASAASA